MNEKPIFYFDMDGTIADLYGVENWLAYLQNEDSLPYRAAAPLVDVERLCSVINLLKAEGYRFGVISWLSRSGSRAYNARVRSAKLRWLRRYFPEIFDEIHIVKYGTPKSTYASQKNAWLFDDERKNREEWRENTKGRACTEKEIFEMLEW